MKKIFSTLILSSLLLPVSGYATTSPSNENEFGQPTRKEKMEVRSELRLSTSTRPQNKETIRSTQLVNASTTRIRVASSTREVGFCSQIDKILVQVDTKTTLPGEKRVENITNREEKRVVTRSEVDATREENDSKRKIQLEELTRRATTEEQKAAVTAFITAVEKALATKKASTDTLLETHRAEIDKNVATRKSAIEKATATLKTDIETAKAKAKSDCANGVNGDTVRTTLKDSIQKAQAAFRTTLQPLQNTADTTKQEAKKKELKVIEDTFKKSVEQAKNNLKSAFKKGNSTATTTN